MLAKMPADGSAVYLQNNIMPVVYWPLETMRNAQSHGQVLQLSLTAAITVQISRVHFQESPDQAGNREQSIN
jgi:hypothetical protein